MEIIIILILLIIYILSFVNTISIYIRKSIDPGFWSITIALTPILNTFIIIKYGNFDSDFGLKEFIEKLNKK